MDEANIWESLDANLHLRSKSIYVENILQNDTIISVFIIGRF